MELLPVDSPTRLEVQDVHQRIVKKLKHYVDEQHMPEVMGIQDPDTRGVSGEDSPKVNWFKKYFPMSVESNYLPQYYMGDDDEEKFAGVDNLFRYQNI